MNANPYSSCVVKRTALRPRYSTASAFTPSSTRSFVSVRAKVCDAGATVFVVRISCGQATYSADKRSSTTPEAREIDRGMSQTLVIAGHEQQAFCDQVMKISGE